MESEKPVIPEPNSDPDSATTVMVGRDKDAPAVAGYRLSRAIGMGGMAKVWLAEDTNLKRAVALKTMTGGIAEDPGFRERFADEAKIVARFRHSNIVTVFASGETNGQPYIAMEYISGGTLADRLAKGPLAPDEALPIAQAMADALAYSHDHDIIHRDLKPGNILFTDDGTPVLSDFGIAKSMVSDSVHTVSGAVIGSPRYMAPEQKLGKPVTAKVDVYALGLVLFEMLVGAVPPVDAVPTKNAADASTLGQLLPVRDKALETLLADCLRDDPDLRPTAQQCADRIDALIAPRRKRAGMILTLVGALGLASLLYFQLRSAGEPVAFDVQPETTTLYVDGQLLSEPRALLDPGAHLVVAVAPRHYGRVLSIDPEVTEQVSLRLEPMALPAYQELAGFHQRFSPDAPLAAVDPTAVSYPPYQTLLRLRGHQRRGEEAQFRQIVRELEALAAVGDPAAQMMLFVAATDQLVSGDLERYRGLVQQASNSGYGLATYYYALYFRWANEQDDALNMSSLQVFRDLMDLAGRQGLEFASAAVTEADDLLRAN